MVENKDTEDDKDAEDVETQDAEDVKNQEAEDDEDQEAEDDEDQDATNHLYKCLLRVVERWFLSASGEVGAVTNGKLIVIGTALLFG